MQVGGRGRKGGKEEGEKGVAQRTREAALRMVRQADLPQAKAQTESTVIEEEEDFQLEAEGLDEPPQIGEPARPKYGHRFSSFKAPIRNNLVMHQE